MIKNSIFKDLGPIDNGAAICTANTKITVFCCTFEGNVVNTQGGSIYFVNGVLSIYQSLFYKCYSSKNKGDVWGNAVFVNAREFNINDTNTRRCGISESLCSDSAIHIEQSITTAFRLNATENYGCGGGAILSLGDPLTGNKLVNLQGYKCHDSMEFEVWPTKVTIVDSNFIDTLDTYSCFWTNAEKIIECNNCLFWNLNKKELILTGYSIILNNCRSNNVTVPSMTLINDYSPNILIKMKKCSIDPIKGCISNNRRMYSLNIFFISMLII